MLVRDLSYSPSNRLSKSTPLQDFAVMLPKWSASKAKTKAGLADTKLATLGDSTTHGYRSNGLMSGDYKTLSWPTQFAGIYTNDFNIPTHTNNFFGNGNSGSNQYQYDPRIVKGSSWTDGATTAKSINGEAFKASTSTNALEFTPTGQVDTFEIFYIQLPSGTSTMDVQIDAEAAVTGINLVNAANGMGKYTITSGAGVGVKTLKITRNAGTAYIVGVNAYNSTIKQIHVFNLGWPSATVTNWAGATLPYASLNAAAALAPDLTIIDLTINDEVPLTSITTYTANLQAIITKMKTVGDVMLLTANPVTDSTLYATLAEQQIYNNINFSLAASNNIPILDIHSQFGSWEAANTYGLMTDPLHPNGGGMALKASAIARVLHI